jgi:hypothetical protein
MGFEGSAAGVSPSAFSFFRNRLNRKTMPVSRGRTGLYGSESPSFIETARVVRGPRHMLLGATGLFSS